MKTHYSPGLKKALLVLCILILTATNLLHAAPKREFRAPWVATVWNIDWPKTTGKANQQQEIKTYLDKFKAMGMTAICFQVRSMCDAMYKSSYEPWSSYLGNGRGTNPGWDPLAFVVDECHKRGLECHAWVNPYRFSSGTNWNTKQDNAIKKYLISHTNAENKTTTILDPGLEFTRNRIELVCQDIITGYDVDGILFDDYFYPQGIPENDTAEDYQTWKNSGTTMSIGDWRRANVNQMVKDVYDMIQSIRPDVRFGIAPAGVSDRSASKYGLPDCKGDDWQYDGIYSDPLAWLADGSIDYISPQIYWSTTNSTNPFGPITEWWSNTANHFGRHHYASHSVSRLEGKDKEGKSYNNSTIWDDYVLQVQLNRTCTKNNAPGSIFYSARNINGPLNSGLGDHLHNNVYQTKSLSPVITWKSKKSYGAPTVGLNGSKLSWNATSDGNRIIKYTVYAFPNSKSIGQVQAANGDGFDVQYLQDVTYTNSYSLPSNARNNHWYAVCVYDGFGNEHTPGYYGKVVDPSPKTELISPNNGSKLKQWDQLFKWKAVPNVTYILEICSNNSFSNPVISVNSLTTNSKNINLRELNDNQTYYWRIKTNQYDHSESVSNIFSFTTPTRPKAPVTTLIYPNDGEFIETDITFEWENVGADSYTLEIASDNSFSTIQYSKNVSSNNYTVSATDLGKGQFFWRVKSSSQDMLSTVSSYRSFKTTKEEIGKTEPGYSIKTDNGTYENRNGATLTNEWTRSFSTPFENFDMTGDLNRSMCAVEGYIYLSHRATNSSSSNIYLRKYNGYTGEFIKEIQLSNSGRHSYFPCNKVMKDNKGHICISNLTLNVKTAPLFIDMVTDLNSGALEKVAECTYSGGGRIDYAAVYGDVTSNKFYVFAACKDSKTVLRWTCSRGSKQSSNPKVCTIKSLYPTDAANLGTAPVIIPINENEFYVDGSYSALTRYDMEGNVTGTFDNVPKHNNEFKPTFFSCNGGTFFEINGICFLAYVAVKDPSYGIEFHIPYTWNKNKPGNNISDHSTIYNYQNINLMWTLPNNSTVFKNSSEHAAYTYHADIQYVPISNNLGYIYTFSPSNGLAGYRLNFNNIPTSVGSIDVDDLNMKVIGNEIFFNTAIGTATVYSMTGAVVASFCNTDSFKLNIPGGIYVIKANTDGRTLSEKFIIR